MNPVDFRRILRTGNLRREDVIEAYDQWVQTWCNPRSAASFREWIGIDEPQYHREVCKHFARPAQETDPASIPKL